jgi:beta-lactamase regulating signal transducer with metallopeptidase domain
MTVVQSAFTQALGWSLIDSLWQMGAMWLMYIIITANGTKYSADKRHTLALLAIICGSLMFCVSISLNIYAALSNQTFYSLAFLVEREISGVTFTSFFNDVIPYFGIAYMPAVLFFAARLIWNFSNNRNRYYKSLESADKDVTAFVTRMTEHFHIPRHVELWISHTAESALTLGFWNPVIILPVAIFSQLTGSQLQAVITHELYHVKRNDYLLNIFLTIAEVIFFFNPFAKLLSGIVKKERENSCDDQVLLAGFSSLEYSEALYTLGRYRYQNHNLAVAATGIGNEYLLQRIRRIMTRRNPTPSVLKPLTAFFLCLIVAGFAGKREKNVRVLATLPVVSDVKPVAYYYEEKTVTVEKPIQPKVKKTEKRKQQKSMVTTLPPYIKADPPLPPPASAPEDELITHYIAAPEVLEFTFIDHQVMTPPETVTSETIHPYIPGSTFYYSEIDTTAGKKVITL